MVTTFSEAQMHWSKIQHWKCFQNQGQIHTGYQSVLPSGILSVYIQINVLWKYSENMSQGTYKIDFILISLSKYFDIQATQSEYIFLLG